MGLAERFKDKLNNKNIFIENNKIEETLKEQEIMFISKPAQEAPIVIEPVNNILEKKEEEQQINLSKFEDLESELINKIRKTPYWEEYSIQRQEKMISSYFIKKVQEYTLEEKKEFIKNTLALANNR